MSDDVGPRSVTPDPRAQVLIRDGRTLFAQGDVERARQCFAAAVAIAPDDAAARAGLDRCRRILAEDQVGAHASPSMPIEGRGTVEIPGSIDLRPELALGAALGDADDGPEATVVDPNAQRLIDAELARARAAGGASRAGASRAAPDADDHGDDDRDADVDDDDAGPDDQTRVEHDPADLVDQHVGGQHSSRSGMAGQGAPGHPYAGEPEPGPFRGEAPRGDQYVGAEPPRPFRGEAPRGDQYVGAEPPRPFRGEAPRGDQYVGAEPPRSFGGEVPRGDQYVGGMPPRAGEPHRAPDDPYDRDGRGLRANDPGRPRAPEGTPGAAGPHGADSQRGQAPYPRGEQRGPGAPYDQGAPRGYGAAYDRGAEHGPDALHDQGAPRGPAPHDQGAPRGPAPHDQAAPRGPGAPYDGVVQQGAGAPYHHAPHGQDPSRPFPTAPAGRSLSPDHSGADPMRAQAYPAGLDAGHASTRFPAIPLARRSRSPRAWWIAGAVVAAAAGIAILIGLAGSDDDGRRARGPSTAAGGSAGAVDAGAVDGEAVAGASGAGADAAPNDRGAGRLPALTAALAPGAAEVRVGRIEHPVVAAVVASTDGVVERIHVKAGGAVTTGQKLYSLRAGKGVGVRSTEVIVTAPAAGRIDRRAARGDRVAKGDVLAQLVDADQWLVIADLRGDQVTTSWSCTIATAEGRNRAPCRVETVQRLSEEQSRATVTIATTQATWLQGGEQALLLRLSPPGAEEPPAPTGGSTATGGASKTTGGAGGSTEAPGGASKATGGAGGSTEAPDGAGKAPGGASGSSGATGGASGSSGATAKDAASTATDGRGPDAGG